MEHAGQSASEGAQAKLGPSGSGLTGEATQAAQGSGAGPSGQASGTDGRSSQEGGGNGPSPTALLQHIEQHMGACTWQQVAELAATLATLSLSPEQSGSILQSLQSEVVRRFKSGSTPPTSTALLAILHFIVGGTSETTFLTTLQNTMRELSTPQPELWACTVAAFSELGYNPGQEFLGQACGALVGKLGGLTPDRLASLMTACARQRYYPGPELTDEAVAAASDKFRAESADGRIAQRGAEFSGMVWAVVMLGPTSRIPRLIGRLLESIQLSQMSWTIEEMGRLVWALASAGGLSENLVAALYTRTPDMEAISVETQAQLAAAYLFLPAVAKYVPQMLLVQSLQARKSQPANPEKAKAAGEVTALLADLKLEPVEGYQLNEGLLRVDVAIPSNKIAITLETQDCFACNAPKQPLGSTVLEWRLLSCREWQVVSLSVKEWNELSTKEERSDLLRKCLKGNTDHEQTQASANVQTPAQGSSHDSIAQPEAGGLAKLREPGTATPWGSSSDIMGDMSKSLGPTTASLSDASVVSRTLPPSLTGAGSAASNNPSITVGALGSGTTPSSANASLGLGQGTSSSNVASGSVAAPGQGSGAAPSGGNAGPARAGSGGHVSGMGSINTQGGSEHQSGGFNMPQRMSGLSITGTEYRSGGSPSGQEGLAGNPVFGNNPSSRFGPGGGMGPGNSFFDQAALANRLAAMPMLPQNAMHMPLNSHSPLPEGGMPDLKAMGMGHYGAEMGMQGQMQRDGAGIALPSSLSLPQMTGLGAGGYNPGGGFPGGPLGPMVPAAMTGAQQMGAQQSQGDLRQLWQMVTQQGESGFEGPKEGVSVAELKRVIELLPLETSAVNAVAPRLALLDPTQFAALLTELARDNHAFRAWQMFDWVRTLPEDNTLQKLCDSNTYTTMIALCGPWQQVRRALSLVADMRARNLECGIQAYSALLNAAVKCGEVELAVDVYNQMGNEGMARERPIFQTMVDVFVKMGRHAEALGVLEDMKNAGQPAEVQLYNLIVLSCTKLNNPRAALDVYQRMAKDGVQPNTKTFTALIGSVGKMSTLEQAMAIIDELLNQEQEQSSLTQTYSALMSACEKAGQWDLAVALFDKMSGQGCKPDVSIFNSMIAACAHGGEYNKARLMFERMAEHECVADAVTYANLIRAYKKGGQWCHALDTFEAMQASGCRPHTAVFSSIIDVLWQTGIAWAQAKARRLFATAVENGSLAGAAESCKKGTLKVDLQALTVGVAVLSMASWLTSARQALMQDHASSLDSSRKLAVVNGLGEHSRAQGHSAAVKEAVGAGLLGCKAPFRLVQDHSRSGRLEASSLALRKWLFSEAFDAYLNLLQGSSDLVGQQLGSASSYLEKETAEVAKCQDLFQRIQTYEKVHPVSFKVLHSHPGPYLAVRKQLVNLTLHTAAALQLSQETAHTALALMDRCVMAGIHLTDNLQALLVCACLRIAAVQESSFVPPPMTVQALTHIPAVHVERMEATIMATLNNDTECISAVHCLKIYLQRLGVDLSNGENVRLAAGCAFALATQALAELPILQFPPSLTAAAVLVAARKAQGSVPFWPSVLSQLTGFTEASTPIFASAIGHAERLCTKLCSGPETPYMMAGPPMPGPPGYHP